MTSTVKLALAVALALLAAGVGLYECGAHRTPAPPAVVAEASHDIGHVIAHEVATDHDQVVTKQATARRVVTRTVVTRPDGERIERETTATTDATTDTHAASVETTRADATADVEHDASRVELRQAPASAPWLRLSIGAEWWSKGLALVPTARAAVELRATAPVLGIAPWVYLDAAPPVLGQRADYRAGVRLVREW